MSRPRHKLLLVDAQLHGWDATGSSEFSPQFGVRRQASSHPNEREAGSPISIAYDVVCVFNFDRFEVSFIVTLSKLLGQLFTVHQKNIKK